MFKNNKYRLSFIRKTYIFEKNLMVYFILYFFSCLALMTIGFIRPTFYRILVNDVILGQKFEGIYTVCIGYLGLFLGDTLICYVKYHTKEYLSCAYGVKIKKKIWDGIFQSDYLEYEKTSIGDLKMRLCDDVEYAQKSICLQTVDYLMSMITMVITLILMFSISVYLSIFSVLAIPLTFAIDNVIARKEKKTNEQKRENDQQLPSWLHTSVQGWGEVKTLNLQRFQKRTLVKYLHRFAIIFVKWINYWTARGMVIPKIKDVLFSQFGLYFLGGILIMTGNLKIGSLFVFAMYHGILSNAVKQASTIDAELCAGMSYTDRLIESLGKYNGGNKSNYFLDGTGDIDFDNVSFSYSNNSKPIFKNLNLHISKGERIAIVGKSGSGKTTLLKLMTGILTPQNGKVSFSGLNVSSIPQNHIHEYFGLISQDSTLFNISIRENLLYGKTDATEEEMVNACKKANIYEYIKSLNNGFDTVVGEKGSKLSGGERQRIILARLFLKNVPVYLFDEATNALDKENERIINETIKNISKDATVVVVSHRESFTKICDKIINLNNYP